MRISLRGTVQGVGFRPFVYGLARELHLAGWVRNTRAGVTIEVEGESRGLESFLVRLERDLPPHAHIYGLETSYLDPAGAKEFIIESSEPETGGRALVLPDIATCPECLAEVLDPGNRRHRYPFTNCTHCGPRFTIIRSTPYDRPNTTMGGFTMCAACRAEYEDPTNRRFHAQPNACPDCGPQLAWWAPDGNILAARHEALLAAAKALRDGAIVAVKGLGGFHLMVNARSEEAVRRLRERKHREEKPLALLYGDLAGLEADCEISELEACLLRAPAAPIVLLRHRPEAGVASSVAPANPFLGAMLPCTPLHHLLCREVAFPLVATSGNLSDEPICTDENEALARLQGIADFLLVHDRPIVRHADDSIVRVLAGRPMMMRRARGYAPLPLRLSQPLPPLLAVGAHLKNTVAVADGIEVYLSQHIGDLETSQARAAFEAAAKDLQSLFHIQPRRVAHDLHPDYVSSAFAKRQNLECVAVQHHYAHVLACMAENELNEPVLGISWDGTGYGPDETVWGGEFLATQADGFTRVGHLRSFPLPGGDAAAREPRRSALGLLYERFGDAAFDRTDLAPVAACTPEEQRVLKRMLGKGLRSPRSTSAGRLFDAVSSLLDISQRSTFEGQGAMGLEFALEDNPTDEAYPLPLAPVEDQPCVVDWFPLLDALLNDIANREPVSLVAARFHNGLVEAMVAMARTAAREAVVLTGGCFQNRYLTERSINRLRDEGFRPYWHQRVPPNDGGIALGQAVAVGRKL